MARPAEPPPADPLPAGPGRRPLYARLLRLHHLELSTWQRVLFQEGVLALAAVLVLADVATAWTLLVLPLLVALIVKFHDLLAGRVQRAPRAGDGSGVRRR